MRFAVLLFVLCVCCSAVPFQHMLDVFADKYTRSVERMGSNAKSPLFTVAVANGTQFQWNTANVSWVRGFFPGTLWQLKNITGNTQFSESAQYFTNLVRSEQYDIATHDVGFLVFLSFGAGVELGGMKSDYVTVVNNAAASLAQRYSNIVNMTRSWGSVNDSTNFVVIIDNLMNLELLLWSGRVTNNDTLTQMAVNHGLKTAKLWIRPDGSTTHMCQFDPKTGKQTTACTATPQGLSANSTWSRGQGWGVYGFTMLYRYTNNPIFLSAAESCAKFYELNSPQGIPLWDYDATDNIVDTSAATITASGLLELSKFTQNTHYSQLAQTIIDNVWNKYAEPYISMSEAVVVGNGKDCGNALCSYVYTDYYLLEAIRRAMDLE